MAERDAVTIDIKADTSQANAAIGGLTGHFAPGVSFDSVGKSVTGAVRSFTRLAGVFGIVYAAARTLASGFEYIDRQMGEANRRALELDKSFGALIRQFESLGEQGTTGFPDLDKKITDIKKLVDESNKLFRSGPFSRGDRDEARNKELVEFQQRLADEQERIESIAEARRERAAQAERDRRFDEAQRLIQSIAAEEMTEEERVNDARERGIMEADALRRKAQDEFERDVAEDLDRAVRARAERELQAIRERKAAEEQAVADIARERERRETEANERIARDMAEQMSRALQEAYARGNAELLAGVNQVNSRLTVTANNILTVVRQLYANQPTIGGR